MPHGRKTVIQIALLHTPQAVQSSGSVQQISAGAPRQYYIAEFVAGNAAANTFVEVPQAIAGDMFPTSEPQYEELVFLDGSRAQERNGDSYPTKTVRLKLPDIHPIMALFYKYEDKLENQNPEKGRFMAYNAFNPDRSGLKGEFKVNAINPVTEGGSGGYDVVLGYRNAIRIPSSANPAPVGDGNPVYASKSPETGPVGTTVTVEGSNLHRVSSITVGGAGTVVQASAFLAQSGVAIVFDIPADVTVGSRAVVLVHSGGSVPAGNFNVTA